RSAPSPAGPRRRPRGARRPARDLRPRRRRPADLLDVEAHGGHLRRAARSPGVARGGPPPDRAPRRDLVLDPQPPGRLRAAGAPRADLADHRRDRGDPAARLPRSQGAPGVPDRGRVAGLTPRIASRGLASGGARRPPTPAQRRAGSAAEESAILNVT